MARLGWLKRRRPDEEDFQDEIRSHLEIAADERVADGADRHSARLSSLKEFGNVTLTTEAARSVWIPRWMDATARSAARRAPRDPRARQEPRILADRLRRAHARHRSQRHGVHAAQELALSPLAGVDGSASLAVVLNETSSRPADVALVSGLPVRPRSRPRLRRPDRHPATSTSTSGSGTRAEPIMGELVTGNYFQQLGVPRTARPDAAAIGRSRARPASGRRPERRALEGAFRQRPRHRRQDHSGERVSADRRRRCGPVVSRHDRQLRRRGVRPDHDGAASPAEWAASTRRTRCPTRGASFVIVMGRLRPGTTRADASAQMAVLSSQLRARHGHRHGRPGARGRSDLAVAVRRADLHAAGGHRAERDGRAAAADRLRQHHRPRARARRLAARGDRAPSRPRRQPGRILRLLLVENLVLAVPAALVAVALVPLAIPALLSGISDVAPIRLFFNLSVDRLVIAFSVLAACASALVFGLLPALRSSRRRSPVGDEGRSLAARRGAGTLSHGARRLAGGGVAAAADRGRAGHAKSRRGADTQTRDSTAPTWSRRESMSRRTGTTRPAGARFSRSCSTACAPTRLPRQRRWHETRR